MALEQRGVEQGSRLGVGAGRAASAAPDALLPPGPLHEPAGGFGDLCGQARGQSLPRGLREPRGSSSGAGGGLVAASWADASPGRAPHGLPARWEPGQSLASTKAHLSPVNTVGRKSQSELKAPGSVKDRGLTGAEGVRRPTCQGRTHVPPSSTPTRCWRFVTLPERKI